MKTNGFRIFIPSTLCLYMVPRLGALSALSSRADTAESIAGKERKREKERNVAFSSSTMAPSGPQWGRLWKTSFLLVYTSDMSVESWASSVLISEQSLKVVF